MNDLMPPAERDMPPGHHELRRTHLVSELSTSQKRSRRWMFGGLATVGLAGTLTAAMVLAPTTGIGDRQPVAAANAQEILNRAAETAEKQPDLKPRPDQFVYVESRSSQAAIAAGEGMPAQPGSSNHRRAWLSVSGKRSGLVIQGGEPDHGRIVLCDGGAAEIEAKRRAAADPQAPVRERPTPLGPDGTCRTSPAYVADLPTDADVMLKWLYKHSQGGNPPDVQAFITVGDTIRESYVSPAAMAAMFRAAGRIPGVTVTKNAVDSAGRRGVAVGQTWNGFRQELIFDPGTYRFLGERTVVDHDRSFRPKGGSTLSAKPAPPPSPQADAPPTTQPSRSPIKEPTAPPMKDGTVLYSSAVLKLAIVDRAGQTP